MLPLYPSTVLVSIFLSMQLGPYEALKDNSAKTFKIVLKVCKSHSLAWNGAHILC